MKRKQEQKGLMLLQGILAVALVGTLLYVLLSKGQAREETSAGEAMALPAVGHPHAPTGRHLVTSTGQEGLAPALGDESPAPSSFDPNEADSATFVALGLSPWQARNIVRYRQRGGQYHRPEDFKRVYGLTVEQWEHIAPRIRIGRAYQYLADVEDVRPSYPRTQGGYAAYEGREGSSQGEHLPARDSLPVPAVPRKLRRGEVVDLARCDTNTLKRIPGIGSYYAQRIVQYAEQLGGFVSLQQLNDEGLDFLPTGIEAYLTLSAVAPKRMRINHMSVRELNRHPYLSYMQARQLAERVRLYGPITHWDALLFLSEFDERDKARLEPYIDFTP